MSIRKFTLGALICTPVVADTTEHPTSEREKNIDEGWLNGLLRGKPAHLAGGGAKIG